MATIRSKRIAYLIGNRQLPMFFPGEARELSRISRAGMSAPYVQRWIASRRRLRDNAIANGWSERQYREYIREQYLVKGAMKTDKLFRWKVDVWAMLRDWAERGTKAGEEYTSPWRKKIRNRSTKKKQSKKASRREFLRNWIIDIQKRANRTNDPRRKAELIKQRDNLQRAYDATYQD